MFPASIKRSIAATLLVYFVFIIVPPLSSFALDERQSERGTAISGVQRDGDRQTALFLFDIVLWQQLKKTKQSAYLAPTVKKILDDKASPRLLADFHGVPAVALPAFCLLFLSQFFSIQRSRASAVTFSRSGSSPPVLFS